MDDEIILNDSAGVANEVVVVGEQSPRRSSPQRGTKRAAPSASSPRKQLITSNTGPPPLTIRGTPASIAAVRGSDAGSDNNVTYRLVQISGSSDNGARHQNILQQGATHIITTNGQGEFVTGAGQPTVTVINSGGLASFGAAANESASTRVTYIPAGAISVAPNPTTVNQPVQLQSFDSGGGQYYIMLPSGSELIQSTPATPTANAITTARVVTAPRLQQAAFIPLSRLEPMQAAAMSSVQGVSGGTAHVVKQNLEFQPTEGGTGTKEIKRRVSHNEVEKRRRDKINNWIAKLARVVPNSGNEYPNSKLPQSKGGVLAKTVDYIQELRETNEHLVDVLRHYESVASCLKEESSQLRDLLHKAGIEAPPPLAFEFPVISESIIAVTGDMAASPTPTTTPAADAVSTILATAASTSTSGGDLDPKRSSTFTLSSGGNLVGLPKGGARYVLVQTNKGMGFVRDASQDHDGELNEHESDGDGGEEHSGQD